MSAFDPYHKWLGIPPEEQPPNYYRLLSLRVFESDLEVIENSADRQSAHVRIYQSGKHSEDSQRILNEISRARVVLLDTKKKAEYDETLKSQSEKPINKIGREKVVPQAPAGLHGAPKEWNPDKQKEIGNVTKQAIDDVTNSIGGMLKEQTQPEEVPIDRPSEVGTAATDPEEAAEFPMRHSRSTLGSIPTRPKPRVEGTREPTDHAGDDELELGSWPDTDKERSSRVSRPYPRLDYEPADYPSSNWSISASTYPGLKDDHGKEPESCVNCGCLFHKDVRYFRDPRYCHRCGVKSRKRIKDFWAGTLILIICALPIITIVLIFAYAGPCFGIMSIAVLMFLGKLLDEASR